MRGQKINLALKNIGKMPRREGPSDATDGAGSGYWSVVAGVRFVAAIGTEDIGSFS
jgi:hypothetical protein